MNTKFIALLSLALLLMLTGCLETEKQVKPLSGFLIPTRADWVAEYGDTMETQVAFNLALIRYDQKQLFRYINEKHPVIDPNVPTLESRVEVLEEIEVERLGEELEEIEIPYKVTIEPLDIISLEYTFDGVGVARKLNEVIDRVNQ